MFELLLLAALIPIGPITLTHVPRGALRGRLRFHDLKRKILEVKARYGGGTLLIEDSPISKGLIQSIEENSINVTPYKPESDKRARLIAQSDLFSGGSVRLCGFRRIPAGYSDLMPAGIPI